MLALGYDPKVSSLMSRLERDNAVLDLEQFDAEDAGERFKEILAAGSAPGQSLSAGARGHVLSKLNERNVDVALALLNKS